MAQVKWAKANATDKIPSYSDGGPNDSETQNKIIEAIQEEQNRVYKQDQRLLHQIREEGTGAGSRSDLQQMDGDADREEEDNTARQAEDIDGEVYEYAQLEDDIIKYICEKIVAMREQPFIDAVENLRRAQELNNL